MDVVDKMFQKMETQNILDYELFDLNGKNYCPVDGTITLKEFVDNDNKLNFYSYVKKINVLKKFVKDNGRRVAVEFKICFQEPNSNSKGPSVVVVWIIEISEQQKITMIDSYWDAAQFKKNLEANYPNFLKIFFRK